MRKITAIRNTENTLTDIRVSQDGKELFLLGPSGALRETSLLPFPLNESGDKKCPLDAGRQLPVLLGSGMGIALEALTRHLRKELGENFHLAVVDKEEDLCALTKLRSRYAQYKNILWLNQGDKDQVLNELGKWQLSCARLPFYPVANPFYLRLDREFYAPLRDTLSASAKFNFWEKAGYAKFKKDSPRILLITSKYFLTGEIEAACERMGLSYSLLHLPDDEIDLNAFMERLLHAIVDFKPDFALTINHLGVDREGVLQDFLSKVRLPLASWFVDNPHLILYTYANLISPWSAIFTWDADNVGSLREMGFEHVFYLPLGTDHTRFAPPQNRKALLEAHPEWKADLSFVGNSMLLKVRKRLEQIRLPGSMLKNYPLIAAGFAESDERSVRGYLQKNHPDEFRAFLDLRVVERQLGYEAMLTWEATLQYRLGCIRATLPFNPLIAGDEGWLELLKDCKEKWRYYHELTYYMDLPNFYPLSEINFNCTSKQMKGAVNQRIFDVPAAGAFIITDRREQMDNLFEPGTEIVSFSSPEEASSLIQYYLKHPRERNKIAAAARKRVLAQHCYEHRLAAMIGIMRKTFG
jgi:spore maturation protein CgeB